MKLIYSAKAEKQLSKLPKREQIKVLKKVSVLKESPESGKRLKGEFHGLSSLRAWPYRIIYQIVKSKKLIYIITIEHRQGVYK